MKKQKIITEPKEINDFEKLLVYVAGMIREINIVLDEIEKRIEVIENDCN